MHISSYCTVHFPCPFWMLREHQTPVESFIHLNSLLRSRFTFTDHLGTWLFTNLLPPFLHSLPGYSYCSVLSQSGWAQDSGSPLTVLSCAQWCWWSHSAEITHILSWGDLVYKQRHNSSLRALQSGVWKICLAVTNFITLLANVLQKIKKIKKKLEKLPVCKNLVFPYFFTTSCTVLELDR